MKMYLAGPMRGYDRFNFPAFDAATARLRELGFEVASPAEHDRDTGFDETLNSLDGFDMRQAFRWDCEQVLSADAVVVLPGWEASTGAGLEVQIARFAGVPVYIYSHDSLALAA